MWYTETMPDRLITRVEAIRLSGIGKGTLANRVREGVIASVVPDGAARSKVSKNSLDDFMAFIWPTDKATKRRRRVGRTNADPSAPAWLYGIHDPKDGQCIYVGYTARLDARWYQHRYDLKRGRHCNHQMQAVYDRRSEPLVFKVMGEGMSAVMLEREKMEIALLREQIGGRLCNATAGGEGTPGMSRATRDRLAAISRAKWRDPEYRRKWRNATGNSTHGRLRNARHAMIMGVRTRLASKTKAASKPKAKRYTARDLVWPTMGGTALFPAKRAGRLYWCSLPLARVGEVVGLNWNITNHNGRGHARLKANVKGVGVRVLSKPWRILGGCYSPSGVALLP